MQGAKEAHVPKPSLPNDPHGVMVKAGLAYVC
jgi:hypothetical protein